ncbi:hypothetical protein [Ahrensia kielensis]|uniref:hypothetical protein n=1 Tax=Ahrensia kielensis TaxID=76980 RepID=UPI00035C0C44|nr:hypothetical protein [Ahrensia kielensis]
MSSKIIKTVFIAGSAIMVTAFAASAASIENKDSSAHTLSVTEDGVKNEIIIGANEIVTICQSGCFITMPNGDRAALSGGESVQIVDGAAIIN